MPPEGQNSDAVDTADLRQWDVEAKSPDNFVMHQVGIDGRTVAALRRIATFGGTWSTHTLMTITCLSLLGSESQTLYHRCGP